MILKFYKSDQIPVLFFLPFLAILFWLPSMLNPTEITFTLGSPLFQWVSENLSPLFSRILAVVIIVFSAIIINGVINNNEIFDRNTYLPALMYLVIMSAVKEYQFLTPIVLSNLFWILAFRRLFNIYRNAPCKREVFDATMLLLLGALFYFPSIVMLPVIWIALKILRPFVWREWVIPIIAVFVFVIYLGVLLFWNNATSSWLDYFNFQSGQYTSIEITMSWMYLVVSAVLLLLISFSAYQLSKQSKGSSLRFRKIVNFFLLIIILTIVLLILVKYVLNENVYALISAVPLSLFLTFYFYYAKREWIAQLLFYSVFLLLLVNIYFY